MDIYYINLARRTDRREFMEAQFAALGLSAVRIEAVTPAEVSPSDLRAWCHPSRLRWMTPPQLCCGLSHIRALQTLLRSGAPHATIFEDDAVLSPKLPQLLKNYDAAPPKADLLRVETVERRLRLKPDGPALGDVEVARFVGWEGGSAGYIANRHAAELLCATDILKQRIADQALFDSEAPITRLLEVRQSNPGFCIQAQEYHASNSPDLPSDLDQADMRAAAERPYRLRHALYRRYRAIRRDTVLAARKAWFVARGARVVRVPFLE